MTLETEVRMLDGPDVPALSVRLFRILQDRPSGSLAWMTGELDDEAVLRTMVDEQRLIYEFDVRHTYGLY